MNGGEIHDYNREREIIKLISGDRFTQSVLNILLNFPYIMSLIPS